MQPSSDGKKEMIQALADARYDGNIGVIILTVAGDKAFCSVVTKLPWRLRRL